MMYGPTGVPVTVGPTVACANGGRTRNPGAVMIGIISKNSDEKASGFGIRVNAPLLFGGPSFGM
jgi:hypothetical protein